MNLGRIVFCHSGVEADTDPVVSNELNRRALLANIGGPAVSFRPATGNCISLG